MLIAHAEAPAYVLFPLMYTYRAHGDYRVAAPVEGEKADVPAPAKEPQDLSAAIATITSAKKIFTESNLPPTPPIPFKRWIPERAPDAPHDPHSYFPMILVK